MPRTIGAPRIVDDWRSILRDLANNWNSYGSPKITEAAIEAMSSFYVVPANDGGIQLEAHFGGKDFGLEISPEGRMKAMFLADAEGAPRAKPAAVSPTSDELRSQLEQTTQAAEKLAEALLAILGSNCLCCVCIQHTKEAHAALAQYKALKEDR